MLRYVCLGVLALLMAFMTADTSLVGQDKVERRDRKAEKAVTVTGKITDESIGGVKVKSASKEETIPATEIVRIYYDDVPVTLKQAYYNLFLNEEKEKDPAKMLKDYTDFYAKAANSPDVRPNVKRYLEYRIVNLRVAAAESEEAKADARRDLEVFIAKHKASWEYAFAARTLARMLLEKDVPDYESAVRVLNDLAGNAATPPDVKAEAEALLIDAMFLAGKTAEVAAKLNAAISDSKTDPAKRERYKLYLIAAEAQGGQIDDVIKKIEDAIGKSNDPTVKAAAYNIIGDIYMHKQMPRDAMWAYLWVDVVYPQDKAEHMKAMTKLLKYFSDEKDEEKAQIYRDKISRLK